MSFFSQASTSAVAPQYLESSVLPQPEQSVTFPNAYKNYDSRKKPDLVLNNLNMSVNKGTM